MSQGGFFGDPAGDDVIVASQIPGAGGNVANTASAMETFGEQPVSDVQGVVDDPFAA